MERLTRERRDLYFMYMNMTQVYEYLTECLQGDSNCEIRQRIEREYDSMREDYDEKICGVTTRIESFRQKDSIR